MIPQPNSMPSLDAPPDAQRVAAGGAGPVYAAQTGRGAWVSKVPFAVGAPGRMAAQVGGGGRGGAATMMPGPAPGVMQSSAATPAGFMPSAPGGVGGGSFGQQPSPALPNYGPNWRTQMIRKQALQGMETARGVSLSHNLDDAYAHGDASRTNMIAGQIGYSGPDYFASRQANQTNQSFRAPLLQNEVDAGGAQVAGANLQNQRFGQLTPGVVQGQQLENTAAGQMNQYRPAMLNNQAQLGHEQVVGAQTENAYMPQQIQAGIGATNLQAGVHNQTVKDLQASNNTLRQTLHATKKTGLDLLSDEGNSGGGQTQQSQQGGAAGKKVNPSLPAGGVLNADGSMSYQGARYLDNGSGWKKAG